MSKRKTDRDGLYKVSNSPYWRGSFTNFHGQRIRRSTGQTDKDRAKLVLAEWIAREGKPSQATQIQLHTFDELMLAYLDAERTLKDREKTAGTRDRDKRCISALYDVFSDWVMLPIEMRPKDMVVPCIDGQAIFQCIERRRTEQVKDSSIRRELAVLGAAITWANAYLGWRLADPTKDRKPSQGEGRVRWITRDEAARLIQAARQESRAPYLADWIQVALYTGCGKGEILGLTWDRVDLQAGTIYLEAEHNKSRRRQSVPLNRQAREAILSRARFRARYSPGSPWVFATKQGNRIKNIRRGFLSACRRAGIEDFTPHDCRHTLASWLVKEGVPLAAIKDVLRHSSITVTERYAHLSPENACAALSVLDVTLSSHCDEDQSENLNVTA
ncbi:MAG: site-specific integrase [Candidatus Competibacteraceae bacterium]